MKARSFNSRHRLLQELAASGVLEETTREGLAVLLCGALDQQATLKKPDENARNALELAAFALIRMTPLNSRCAYFGSDWCLARSLVKASRDEEVSSHALQALAAVAADRKGAMALLEPHNLDNIVWPTSVARLSLDAKDSKMLFAGPLGRRLAISSREKFVFESGSFRDGADHSATHPSRSKSPFGRWRGFEMRGIWPSPNRRRKRSARRSLPTTAYSRPGS